MIHTGIQLEVKSLRITHWFVFTCACARSQPGSVSEEIESFVLVERMRMMVMECSKFSPGTPTCTAEGGADPSLTTDCPITVQQCTVGELTADVLGSLRSEINHNRYEGSHLV